MAGVFKTKIMTKFFLQIQLSNFYPIEEIEDFIRQLSSIGNKKFEIQFRYPTSIVEEEEEIKWYRYNDFQLLESSVETNDQIWFSIWSENLNKVNQIFIHPSNHPGRDFIYYIEDKLHELKNIPCIIDAKFEYELSIYEILFGEEESPSQLPIKKN